ncbi:MAG: LysR family transcriptional regulator [Rhodoblastus sp.]
MNRLEAMTTLLAVVDAGSLSAASRKLRTPLATVSRRISDLEKVLGARLLLRSNRRLELTDAGAGYVAACRTILDQLDHAERAASGEYLAPRGAIAISAPIVFGRLHLLPVLVDFLAAYPDIDASLALSDRMAHFIDDQVDAALRIGELPDSTLRAARVGSVRRVICASPGYLARSERRLETPEDLGAHACITFDSIAGASEWVLRKGKQSVAIAIRSRLVVNTAEAAIDAAIAGLGVTRVLSYQVERAVERGELEIVLEACEPAPMPVSLVYPAQGAMPQKLRAFLDFTIDRLREKLAQP